MHLELRLHAREVLLLGLCSLICCRIFMAHGRTGPLHRAGQSVRLVAFLSVSIPSKSFAFLANPVPAPAASAVRQVTRQQFGARANPRMMLNQRLATAHVSKNVPAKASSQPLPALLAASCAQHVGLT